MFLQGLNLLRILDYRPKFIKENCIRKISSRSSCNLCESACQSKAIKTVKKGIQIENDCNQCGQCIVSCPTNALSHNDFNFVNKDNKVYVVCSKSLGYETFDNKMVIYCLKKLNLKVLLNLADKNITTIVTNMDFCNNCKEEHNLEQIINEVNYILTLSNKEKINIEKIDIEHFNDNIQQIQKAKANRVVQRRDFFKEIFKDSMEVVKDIAPPTILVKSLKPSEEILENWFNNKEQKVSLFNINIEKSKCIECGACIKLCPNSVWSEEEEKLIFSSYECNGCKICEDICVSEAIHIEKKITKTKQRIYYINEYKCDNCEKTFYSYIKGRNICPDCTRDEVFANKFK